MFSSIGSIIIDDIVLPDGRTFMGMLGGGMTHAAMGMRVWTDAVRPIAAIGAGFPDEMLAQMGALFDLRAIVRRNCKTTRAWQLFEENGHRTEVFRTPIDEFVAATPRPHEIPAELLDFQGVHSQLGTPDEYFPWIARLRTAGCRFVFWEPWELYCNREHLDIFLEMARLADGVSPNLEEARQLTGKVDPKEILQILLESCPLVAIRMGSEGSLVGQRDGPFYRVSIASAPEIVDVTGAGNAYCGGFVVGLVTTGDLAQAARYAAVSASFALGQFGAIYSIEGVQEQAKQRLSQVEVVKLES